MKKEEFRKVEFRNSIDGGYNWNTYTGYFHMWGLDAIRTVSDNGNDTSASFTVAIVEGEDGVVVTINPEYIKFI